MIFVVKNGIPELWDPLTGESRLLPEYKHQQGITHIPLQYAAHQSYFIIFDKNREIPQKKEAVKNFPDMIDITFVSGPWEVSFDPKWGGPESIIFENLEDWTLHPEEGIRYYSGKAVYRNSFDLPENTTSEDHSKLYLDLGKVNHMVRVRLNGEMLGIVWTSPWRIDISGVVREQNNMLEIEVVNLWPNRLIGDERLPYDGIMDGEWPAWLPTRRPAEKQ